MDKVLFDNFRIGEKLKEIRIKNYLTLDDLEYNTKINKQIISQIENGLKTPSLNQLITLANFYNLCIDDLIDSDFYELNV